MPLFRYETNQGTFEIESNRQLDAQELQNVVGEFKDVPLRVPSSREFEGVEKVGVFGTLFSEPSAAATREAIREKPIIGALGPFGGPLAITGILGQEAEEAAKRGAIRPSISPTFQTEAIQEATKEISGRAAQRKGILSPQTNLGRFLVGAESFITGLKPSVIGLGADFATNPSDVLLSVGDIVSGVKVAKQIVRKPKEITKIVSKIFKPGTRGVRTAKQAQKQSDELVDAVDSVYDNLESLVIGGEQGKVPQNVDELLQGVSQTKEDIFKAYDDLKRATGDAGVILNKDKIAQEILEIYSKEGLKFTDEAARSYASQRTLDLENIGDLTPDLAQDIIKNINQKVRNLYRGGIADIDLLGKSGVEANIAKVIRRNLDEAISKETGQAYQLLKNKYGALSQAEELLTKRAIAEAKKSGASLFDLVDAISSGQIVQGLATGDISTVTRGIAQTGFKNFLKSLNDPNKLIQKTFKVLDKAKKPKRFIPTGATAIAGEQAIREHRKLLRQEETE